MPLPASFSANTTPTGVQLDSNFTALGALTPIPCAVAGTNALTLTLNTNTPTVSALANYMQFIGIAAHTNTSSMTAVIGAIAPLPIYKDGLAGPVALTGGEIVQNCAFALLYDSTLNTGSGGFHLQTGGAVFTGQTLTVQQVTATVGQFGTVVFGFSTSLVTLTRLLQSIASVGFTVIPSLTTQDVAFTLSGVQVNDIISLGVFAAPGAGLVFDAYCATLGTINIRAANVTGASIAAFGGTFRVEAKGYA